MSTKALATKNGSDELVALPADAGDEGAQTFALMRMALDKGGDAVNQLEKLVGMYERFADRKARKDFINALAKFQQECPAIEKNRKKTKADNSGSSFGYEWADFDQIVDIIRPHLTANGLSITFDGDVSEDGKWHTTTCTLRHVNGASEVSRAKFPITSSAGMSEQQKVASANSYGKRYALASVLGLSVSEPEAPSAKAEREAPVVTEEEVTSLKQAMQELKVTESGMLTYLQLEGWDGLTRAKLKQAHAALATRRKSGGAQ